MRFRSLHRWDVDVGEAREIQRALRGRLRFEPPAGPPGLVAGADVSWASADKRVLVAVLRTRTGVKPVYVSPGHRMDVEGAVESTNACLTHFRLPEPIRRAHRLTREARREPIGTEIARGEPGQ